MAEASDEEDDYLNMTFSDPSIPVKETSLQRTARLKKEAVERSRIPSKAELVEKEKAARDAALATELDSSTNKGAKMMAKMGFVRGGALGQTENARTQPIELLMKDDRGGIGMDSEKKRKVREAAVAVEVGEKRQKFEVDQFRERNRSEREEKRAEGLMWGAMKVLEGFEEDGEVGGETEEAEPETRTEFGDVKEVKERKELGRLRDANVLYRPLIKQRVEGERDRRMRYELNNSLSNRNDSEGDDDKIDDFDSRAKDLDDEDPELQEFEALSFVQRQEKVVTELRERYRYCFWCKHRYRDEEMDGCPGLTEDEHG